MTSILLNFVGQSPAGTAAVATATWNPSDAGSNITLTSGNLIATGSSASNFTGRATHSQTTGLRYFEFSLSANSTLAASVGVCSSAIPTSSDIYDGSFGRATPPNSALAIHNDGTFVQAFNQSAAVFVGSGSTSITYGVLMDLTNQLCWVTANGSTWVIGGGSFTSPSSSGFAITGISSGTALFPAYSLNTNGTQTTANFGGSAYTYGTPPSASNW